MKKSKSIKKVISMLLSVSLVFCWSFVFSVSAQIDPQENDPSYGDVDRSGNINIGDVTLIQKSIAHMETFDEEQEMLADFNGDGKKI